MVLVLDEAANICRIGDLPDLYSHLGGRGMIPVTILQSYEQGITVWSEHGMAALWGSATKKLIGAGVDSPRLTRDMAVLIGHHDVPVRSISIGDGRASEQISYQRRMILEAARPYPAALPAGRTGRPAAHPRRPQGPTRRLRADQRGLPGVPHPPRCSLTRRRRSAVVRPQEPWRSSPGACRAGRPGGPPSPAAGPG